jgi:1,4-alpha-glucan branching enzyme
MDMATLESVKKTKESGSRPQQMTGAMHEVEFTCHAPAARKVCIAGNFNAWNASSMPMKKEKDGAWRIKLKLSPGKYEYKYFVDGAWASDQSCSELVPNPFGTDNCVISIH